MTSTVVTAMAAALGSLVGAAASIATTWITQRTQTIRAHSEWKLRERESLYKEFITEASRLAVEHWPIPWNGRIRSWPFTGF